MTGRSPAFLRYRAVLRSASDNSQLVPVDLSGTPSVAPRILVVSDPILPAGERTFARNFRTEAVRLPALGTLGTLSKTLLRGPGVNNWDVSILKNFPIGDRVKFQFRGELYSALNHIQFSAFDATGAQVNGQFGQFTAAREAGQIQMSIRVQF